MAAHVAIKYLSDTYKPNKAMNYGFRGVSSSLTILPNNPFTNKKKQWKTKKKVVIPEEFLKEIPAEVVQEILDQVKETEKDLEVDQEVPKQVLELMKGKKWCDITNTMIALGQLCPATALLSIHKTLGMMLRIKALKMLAEGADPEE